MYYIQRQETGTRSIETVDEFETRKEAQAMRAEYCMADPYARYYISHRPCRAWSESINEVTP